MGGGESDCPGTRHDEPVVRECEPISLYGISERTREAGDENASVIPLAYKTVEYRAAVLLTRM